MKICFVGGGNIAQAIINGLLKSGLPPQEIACIERNQEKIDLLESQKITMTSFECLSENTFDLIVLAVKPKDALTVAQKIEGLAPQSNILTVVAGIGISKYPTSASIIRSMPNTASAYNKGITALYAKDQLSPAFKNACNLFERVGHVMVMENEDDIHSFTSIIGSGQAFLFQVLNVYLKELKAINKDNDEHAVNIFQDFVSSLGDLFEKERDFEILINKIKSPGGTTQAGLESLGIIFNFGKSVQEAMPINLFIMLLGVGSAVIDNVPLVAASMGMFDVNTLSESGELIYAKDSPTWHFIAYSAGTGGSMLIIGSAAGVVAMGMEKISFFWYLKNIGWLALIGYLTGAGSFLLLQTYL